MTCLTSGSHPCYRPTFSCLCSNHPMNQSFNPTSSLQAVKWWRTLLQAMRRGQYCCHWLHPFLVLRPSTGRILRPHYHWLIVLFLLTTKRRWMQKESGTRWTSSTWPSTGRLLRSRWSQWWIDPPHRASESWWTILWRRATDPQDKSPWWRT